MFGFLLKSNWEKIKDTMGFFITLLNNKIQYKA